MNWWWERLVTAGLDHQASCSLRFCSIRFLYKVFLFCRWSCHCKCPGVRGWASLPSGIQAVSSFIRMKDPGLEVSIVTFSILRLHTGCSWPLQLQLVYKITLTAYLNFSLISGDASVPSFHISPSPPICKIQKLVLSSPKDSLLLP